MHLVVISCTRGKHGRACVRTVVIHDLSTNPCGNPESQPLPYDAGVRLERFNVISYFQHALRYMRKEAKYRHFISH